MGNSWENNEEFAGLAEVIRQVRAELESAREEGEGKDLRFTVEKVSLEFAVQVRKAGSGKAGVRIAVVTAEAGAERAKESTHRVQIEMKPEQDFPVSRG